MKLTIDAPPAPKPIDKNRAYRPRVKRDAPLIPCEAAMPFLERFSDFAPKWARFSARDIVVSFFRISAKCGYEPEQMLTTAERYCRNGGDDWTVTDFRWAQTCLAALKEHPESALALAKQCVDEYGKK